MWVKRTLLTHCLHAFTPNVYFNVILASGFSIGSMIRGCAGGCGSGGGINGISFAPDTRLARLADVDRGLYGTIRFLPLEPVINRSDCTGKKLYNLLETIIRHTMCSRIHYLNDSYTCASAYLKQYIFNIYVIVKVRSA